MADGPLSDAILQRLKGRVVLLPWQTAGADRDSSVAAIFTYGHPVVDGALLDRFPTVRVVSNFGVGVDHIDLAGAAARNVRVGHTPGVLDGAVADMAFALLLAAARGVVQGDRHARSPGMTRYDPSYLLGGEVHGSTLGIVGMGRIGAEVARRARAFQMAVLYHNRTRRKPLEGAVAARYVRLEELLAQSDHIVLTVSLTDQDARPDRAGGAGAHEIDRRADQHLAVPWSTPRRSPRPCNSAGFMPRPWM